MDFTLLRLILASDVIVAHYRELTGFHPWWLIGFSSTVAVQAFFVISGWIVTASYESSSNATGFFVRRMARLYPLYAVVVLLQAVGAIILMHAPDGTVTEVLHYLALNLTFANFAKPSLLGFLDTAKNHAINPALWTLKVEVMFYLSVPLLVMLKRRYQFKALCGIFIASTIFYYITQPISAEVAKQLPGQLRFFVVGMMCKHLIEKTVYVQNLSKFSCFTLGVFGLTTAQYFDTNKSFGMLQPFFVAALVVGFTRISPKFKRFPDISFGVYLIHSPIIQFFHDYGNGLLEPGNYGIFITIFAVAVLSILAAYMIEQPAIRWGQKISRRLTGRETKLSTPGLKA